MAVVSIPDITTYHLPKMILKNIEIIHGSEHAYDIGLTMDYEFIYRLQPGRGATSQLLNKYIKPIVVAMPTIDLALLYENYIKNYSDDIAKSHALYMLPYHHYAIGEPDNPVLDIMISSLVSGLKNANWDKEDLSLIHI